jgi:uncharacterized membrane protein
MAMNPFDWRTVLLAKHAQHVVLIHFPIALFIVGVALDLLAQWKKRRDIGDAAYFSFVVAAIATLPTIATGLAAWQWQLEGRHLKGLLLFHLLAAAASSVVICLTWWMHCRARKSSESGLPAGRWLLEAVGVVLLIVTGHLGGFLSGVNGGG